jgi:acetoin:2,6-dichlorophenolindophenol oxidoreductase subunit alpha
LVVARLLMLCGHGEHDDACYIDVRLKQSPLGRDCMDVAEQVLIAEGWAQEVELKQWKTEAQNEVDEAVSVVQREPAPDPYKEDWSALASKHFGEGYLDLA